MVSIDPTIQKRIFLIENLEWILTLLAYHKAWSDKVKTSKSVTLWTWGQAQSGCDINAVT